MGVTILNQHELTIVVARTSTSRTLARRLNIIGGARDDTFTLVDGATLVGYIDGKGGANTLNFSAYTTALTVTLTGLGDVVGLNGTVAMLGGGFKNVTKIISSGVNGDMLIGADLSADWETYAAGGNGYVIGTEEIDFSQFETLVGGAGNDRFEVSGIQNFNINGGAGDDLFIFADGARLIGNIDGFGGHDTLDFSAYTTARRILLTSYDSEDGFVGTDTSPSSALVGLFRHINEIIGSSDPNDPDLLIGLNNSATWDVGAANQYHVNPTLDFFEL